MFLLILLFQDKKMFPAQSKHCFISRVLIRSLVKSLIRGFVIVFVLPTTCFRWVRDVYNSNLIDVTQWFLPVVLCAMLFGFLTWEVGLYRLLGFDKEVIF